MQAQEKLPTPIRIVVLLVISSVVYILNNAQTKRERIPHHTDNIPGAFIMLMGQAHALAFHIPSMWSTRLHAASCLQLTEHIFYYGILQSVVIEASVFCLVLWRLQQGTTSSLIACYCGWYYAWSVSQMTLAKRKTGTLAPYMLVLSMVLYACITIPYYFYYQYDYDGSKSKEDHALNHLVAWSVADMCHYAMSLRQSLPKMRHVHTQAVHDE